MEGSCVREGLDARQGFVARETLSERANALVSYNAAVKFQGSTSIMKPRKHFIARQIHPCVHASSADDKRTDLECMADKQVMSTALALWYPRELRLPKHGWQLRRLE